MKKKIPSRKFAAGSRKIASRPFPKRRVKLKPVAEPETEPETPLFEGTREERLAALKSKLQEKLKPLQKPE